MKKLIILLLLALVIPLAGQDIEYSFNQKEEVIVYGSFAPQDLGLGFRVDIKDGYLSYSYGNYKLPFGGYIHDHEKLAIGFLFNQISAGVTFHDWAEPYIPDPDDNPNTKNPVTLEKHNLRHFSFELGVRIRMNRLIIAARTDILRFESVFDIGYAF